MQMRHFKKKLAVALMMGTALSGCNLLNRLADVGQEPKLATINNPTHEPGYRPISMPMPSPLEPAPNSNSLWRPGSRAFLKDLRANEVGDIVTVVIDIDDEATLNNSTTRTRAVTDTTAATGLLGYQADLGAILPEAVDPTNLLNVDTDVSQVGGGVVDRDEDIDFEVAAVVTQVLPNGNLVIHGRQETRVNFEVRELQVAGVIRPQDITTSNQIAYEDIAEARLAYGGRGQITDMTQPRYGSQIIDIILPF